jgi:hypothetical protein
MRQLALSLFLILCASLMPVHAADSSSTNQREALPLPPITIYHLEAWPAYQRMGRNIQTRWHARTTRAAAG